MPKNLPTFKLAITAYLLFQSVPLWTAHGEEVNDLIEAILESSPAARAKAESYAATTSKEKNFKKASEASIPKSNTRKPLRTKATEPKPPIPVLEIPSEDLLAVDAKFPKNYVGKFVYGRVKLTYIQPQQYADLDPYVTLEASNLRGFYLDFQDPEMVRLLSKYRRGDVFVIPKEHPLRIVGRSPLGPFGPYWLKLPSETSLGIKP
jgi:hypothetical protein